MAKTAYQLRYLPEESIKAIRPNFSIDIAQQPIQARACGSTKSCMFCIFVLLIFDAKLKQCDIYFIPGKDAASPKKKKHKFRYPMTGIFTDDFFF